MEKCQLSTLFHRKNRKSDETDWQLLLYSIARTYINASKANLHVSREDNPGPGEIDMHFTRGTEVNICLEMEVSSNGMIVHGYKEQLKGYMQADGSKQGIYMIVLQDNQHEDDIKDVIKLAEENRSKGVGYAPEVIVVNGMAQVSASKKEYVAL